MANKIRVKLILELRSAGMSRNLIASTIMDRIVVHNIWIETRRMNMSEYCAKNKL